MHETRVTKPTSAQQPSRSGRRRGPYALRACDACRRRKGKCDGNQPCGHCAGRGRACLFSSVAQGEVFALDATCIDDLEPQDEDEQRASLSPMRTRGFEPFSNQCAQVPGQDPMSLSQAIRHVDQSEGGQESLLNLVAQLQRQLDNLASRVNLPEPVPAIALGGPAQQHHTSLPSPTRPISFPQATTRRPDSSGAETSPLSARNFCGPTSPDYSLNMAQMKLRQRSHSISIQPRPTLASMNNGATHGGDDEHPDGMSQISTESRRSQRAENLKLLYFRSILGLEDIKKLLHIYQEVVGEFHPVVDIEELAEQAHSWCSGSGLESSNQTAAEENNLLILNLALAIALRAESTSATSNAEMALQSRFQDALNAKLAAPATTIKDVVIVLLAGLYDYFQDEPRCAWRMCGTAGRLLMELGFHNGEVSKHILTSEAQKREVAVVTASVVILDRQWSAATGLPPNFQDSSFDTVPRHLIESPYLNAMTAFLIISDKFADSISKAAKGDINQDNDTYEIMNFQLEQWRRKAIGQQSLSQIRVQLASPSTRPPSWTILLALRAESVRTLLLRPFFFPNTDEEIGERNVRPALDLVSNVVHILYTLDTETDLYRMQRPFYQHVLASTCALFFLLVTFVERRSSEFTESVIEHRNCIQATFHMAMTLAVKYGPVSRASRRLGKRLVELRDTLDQLGVLDVNGHRSLRDQATVDSSSHHPMPWNNQAAGSSSVEHDRATASQPTNPQVYSQFVGPQTVIQGYASHALDGDRSFQTGWAESILFDWPMAEQEAMFGLRKNP
ncbi:uncharacterized protein F5Z01DRAFT_170004 [Emericellopsis atlantica]|uniref:Zn(2)-C6 fungal-type domain-containing protein n=1 Tax=Emericellopsis atlantica TaxID=2614577 RepID=A0A9P8CNB6_9HYPO|nr:uncharacterized protein F5Z01DRAFT_170004 [Emericellopsis atlantica]KAG9252972.1 hypothetical protein F5Z01DRAFT_170004 [Emericellopsis atlantica]